MDKNINFFDINLNELNEIKDVVIQKKNTKN